MNRQRGLIIACSLSLFVAGCGPREESKDKIYDIEGIVVSVNPEKKSVRLDHKDIPGLMQGMEMPFGVEDAKVLEGIKSGDTVKGRLKVKTGGGYSIMELKKQ